jgi:hypothetical protein
VAILVAAAVLAPPRASAQESTTTGDPVATAVLYEVNEALRFVKTDRNWERERQRQRSFRESSTEVARRLARASLLGREVKSLQEPPGDIFKEGSFIAADAMSNVDLSKGTGPIHGKLKLLTDLDPNRESLDTLVVDTEAIIKGELDLTTALQGFAALRNGRWTILKSTKAGSFVRGTFEGMFLIPFLADGDERYFYLDIAGPADPCAAPEFVTVGGQTVPACPLESFEFALGIPLTKAVVTFFQ